jgi:1,4-alpha-glucan branching enzyme
MLKRLLAPKLCPMRHDCAQKTFIATVGHYTPIKRENYRVGVPRKGWWRELINTDSHYYGGSGAGNGGGVHTEDIPCDGFEQSLRLVLPPLSTTLFKWTESEA